MRHGSTAQPARVRDGPEPGEGGPQGHKPHCGEPRPRAGSRGGSRSLRVERALPCTLTFSPSPHRSGDVHGTCSVLGTAGHPRVLTTAGQTGRRRHTGRDRASNNSQHWEGRRGATGQLGPWKLGPCSSGSAWRRASRRPASQRAGQEVDRAGEKRPGLQALQRWPRRTGRAGTTARTRLGSWGQAHEVASQADRART